MDIFQLLRALTRAGANTLVSVFSGEVQFARPLANEFTVIHPHHTVEDSSREFHLLLLKE